MLMAIVITVTVEPLLRGHPDERPLPLERPLDKENLNINVLISIPDERPPLLKGHFYYAKGVASQEGFQCTVIQNKRAYHNLKVGAHVWLPLRLESLFLLHS